LRTVILDALIVEPPADPGERWFCDDLARFSSEELREERRRLRLRRLLTAPREKDRWPAVWLAARLERVEALLRADTTAAAWARARRR
jgi:hypothetical protein